VFPQRGNSENGLSSDQSTLPHCSSVQFAWFFAQASRAFLWALVKSGFFRAFLAGSPASVKRRRTVRTEGLRFPSISFISAARLTAVCFLFLTLLILSARSAVGVVARGRPVRAAFSVVPFSFIFFAIRPTVVRWHPSVLAMLLWLIPCASPIQTWPFSWSQSSEVGSLFGCDAACDRERFRPTFRGPGLGSTLIIGGEVVPWRHRCGGQTEISDVGCFGPAENTPGITLKMTKIVFFEFFSKSTKSTPCRSPPTINSTLKVRMGPRWGKHSK
jgi:hypothetical protein